MPVRIVVADDRGSNPMCGVDLSAEMCITVTAGRESAGLRILVVVRTTSVPASARSIISGCQGTFSPGLP